MKWAGSTPCAWISQKEDRMAMGIDIFMNQLNSKEDSERYNALQELLRITEKKVMWFSQYKDELIEKLNDQNSYQRSIGAMLLCNLAKNDDGKKEYEDILDHLLPLIDDEKFITQRQCIQNIWKIAVVDEACKEAIVSRLQSEFSNCIGKKHCNLLRIDIISSLANIAKDGNDGEIMKMIERLVGSEDDPKSKKKYEIILKQN